MRFLLFLDHQSLQRVHCSFYKFHDMDSHNDQVDIIKNDHAKESQENIQDTPRVFYSDLDFGEEANKAAESLINSFQSKKEIEFIN